MNESSRFQSFECVGTPVIPTKGAVCSATMPKRTYFISFCSCGLVSRQPEVKTEISPLFQRFGVGEISVTTFAVKAASRPLHLLLSCALQQKTHFSHHFYSLLFGLSTVSQSIPKLDCDLKSLSTESSKHVRAQFIIQFK